MRRAQRVIACCAVAAILSVRAAETGPRLGDEAFFQMLDLSQPGLAAVRPAVEASDWPAAKRALATHFRSRTQPRWFETDLPPVGHDKKYRSRGAENALQHRFTSIGIEWPFGETIDWAFNPTTQPDSKWPRNHEWTWQLSRHPMWIDLSRAYRATGDEKYAREFVAELRSWVRDCPVPLDKPANSAFSRWRTIEAGIRTGSVWPEVFFRFLPAQSFDDDAVVLMVKSFVEHAQYLTKFHMTGNWLTMEANGLYHVGALFPEFKEAQLWRDTAIGRLYPELDIQVYPDGAQVELAPGYHGVALRNFLGPVELVPLTGFELPKDYLAKIERMYDYFLFSMQPTRRTPPLNDSGAGDVVREMRRAGELFPGRADFRWVATDGKEGAPPAGLSHLFPYAGQFILRSGWTRDALWLCMDGGPFGFGHQHEDKLGILLTAFGKSLLVEGGVYTYDASDWRNYVLSSRAHNVVLVDGLEQSRRKSPRESFVVKTPLPHIWETNTVFDHVAAFYDEGWGDKATRVVKHIRHVFFIKPDLFIVADEMQPADDRPHTYEALFHLDTPGVATDGLTVATQNDGANLAVRAFGADAVGVVKGRKDPVQGWLPDAALGYGGIRPIPTAVYEKRAAGKVQMVYALAPSSGPAACPVAHAEVAEGRLRLRMTDGQEKEFHFKTAFDDVM